MDKKDNQILYELSKNARLSASKIAKKVGLKKETVVYRINRMLKEGIIKRVIAMINTEGLGFTRYEMYLQLKNADIEKEKEILNELAGNKMFMWVISGLGEFEVLTEFYARNPHEYEKIVNGFRNKYGEYIKRISFAVVINEHSFPLKLIGHSHEEPLLISSENVEVDGQDLKILKELAENARASIVDISKNVGLSPDSIVYRIKNLQKKKMIAGYRTIVNESKLGLQKYKLLLKLRNSDEELQKRILNFLKHHKAVQYIKKCIGEWDFSITLVAGSTLEFRNIILELKNELKDNFEGYVPLILFDEYKNTYFPKGILN